MTDELFVAQCFIFWGAGFETTSSVLTFALYELAKHKEIQEHFFDEIKSTLQRHNNELNYEGLQEMTYLAKIVDGKKKINNFHKQRNKYESNF